jgi:WD40 repeat protein
VIPPNGGTGPDGQPLPATAVYSAAWTPDGGTLVLGAVEGGAVFESTAGYLIPVDTTTWDIGAPVADIGAAQSIETSPDAELLAVASAAAEIVLLDAASLEVRVRVPLADGDRATDLDFSRDGRLLAVGVEAGGLYVFDTRTWDLAAAPSVVHGSALVQVEWLPDGSTVATAGVDGTASLFDIERGLVRGRPLGGSGAAGDGIVFLAPDPRDELVVLGERGGRRYPLEPSDWLEEACAVVGRDLTRVEWQRYLPERNYQPTCTDLS